MGGGARGARAYAGAVKTVGRRGSIQAYLLVLWGAVWERESDAPFFIRCRLAKIDARKRRHRLTCDRPRYRRLAVVPK